MKTEKTEVWYIMAHSLNILNVIEILRSIKITTAITILKEITLTSEYTAQAWMAKHKTKYKHMKAVQR